MPKKKPLTTDAEAPEATVEDQDGEQKGPPLFPVVGVGASAGGLDAFRELLRHLGEQTGMAFVLVQHLDPRHESLLGELLRQSTPMPVADAADGMAVQPDHIYVIPPNCSLGILNGRLQVLDRVVERGRHLPVDYFLNTLAEDRGNRAIGVILSGTASDGTLGLKAIKAASGITFAQDEESAEYFGMPGSAIAAGCVDFVLPPREIGRELVRIARHPYLLHPRTAEAQLPEDADSLNKIFLLLRSRTGNDFTYYKHSTIKRRVKRRMLVHKLERLRDYVRHLQATPGEVDALFQDILINVTGFFRDPETFEALKKEVFPRLLDKRPGEAPLRIWVPGCATGEEAYSVAIALLEHLGDRAAGTQVQVFATDIDPQAIDQARQGLYPERIAEEVSKERLRRFFVKVANGYQISKNIRDLCVFAVQNVTKDPPFSKLDLICCRNLLIYLGALLQKKVFQIFHYALQPGGFLMLGTSESIGAHADLFSLVDKKSKIYLKKSIAARVSYEFSARPDLSGGPTLAPVADRPPAYDIQQEAEQLILNRYAPAGVIVGPELEILHFRGQTGPFIEPSPGAASLNLLRMVRQELAVELRAAVHQATRDGDAVRKEGIRFQHEGSTRRVNIQVLPMKGPLTGERCMLVLFETPASPEAPGQEAPEAAEPGNGRAKELERELANTREYMQSIIEEQEATNEELKSANEEIQSTNEELQSTNEELETAKEELQSTNEELATVNEELENRNADLALANNDLTNLLASVSLPILMLGQDLRIRQFTPQAEKLLNLIGTDLGRPISNIKPNVRIPDLEHLVSEVMDSMTVKSLEVEDDKGHWYSMRLRPYKTLDNRIEGVVVTFIDVDEIKDARRLRSALEQERRLAAVVRDANDAVTVQDFDGRILAWNPAAARIYGYSESEALTANIRRLIPVALREEHERMTAGLRKAEPVKAFETTRLAKDGRELRVWLSATALCDQTGTPYAIATTERDLSQVRLT